MRKRHLIYGQGVITNDAWLAHHLTSPVGWKSWEPLPHAQQLVADGEAGMTGRDLARKYGYAQASSANKAFREWRQRFAKLQPPSGVKNFQKKWQKKF